jgi:hypothetical protein
MIGLPEERLDLGFELLAALAALSLRPRVIRGAAAARWEEPQSLCGEVQQCRVQQLCAAMLAMF